MVGKLIVEGLKLAGGALVKAAKSPAVRKAVVNAAQKAKSVLSKSKDAAVKAAQKSKEVFKKGLTKAKQACKWVRTQARKLKKEPKVNRQKQDGHVSGTPQHANRLKVNKPTSTFSDRATADKLTQEAWLKGDPVKGRPGLREYNFGKPIGNGPNGGTQSWVRVHQSTNGQIHGHPSGPVKY